MKSMVLIVLDIDVLFLLKSTDLQISRQSPLQESALLQVASALYKTLACPGVGGHVLIQCCIAGCCQSWFVALYHSSQFKST
jgi:hypothetical protein